MLTLDETGKFWLPWNNISSEIKHDMRFFISMLQEEPYAYKVSKIKNTSPKGIITVTVEQDRFDSNKDYVNLDTGEMYADYYSSAITPKEEIPQEETTDVLLIEAVSYNVRIRGSKVVYAKILDKDGNDVTNNYDGSQLEWSFKIKDDEFAEDSLIEIDETYRYKEGNQYKCKFKFNGDEDYVDKRIIAEVKIKNLSANAELSITA